MKVFGGRGLILCVMLCAAACGAKPDAAAVAKAFFTQIGSGQASEAYAGTAFGFQAQQTQKAFEQTVREMGLTESASSTWESPEMEAGVAKLHGVVQTKTGGQIPLVVTLTEESGSWRIFALKSPRSLKTGVSDNRFSLVGKGAAFSDSPSQPMPDEKTIRQASVAALLRFNEAVAEKSFEKFYEGVSRAWQKQLTVGQLQRAFQPFIDNGIDLPRNEDLEIVFDVAPQITSDGLLVVAGHYPVSSFRAVFVLRFIYELPRWQLFGIEVNILK